MQDLIVRQWAIDAVKDEPDLPGTITDELWNIIRNNRIEAANILRISVVSAKNNIAERISKL